MMVLILQFVRRLEIKFFEQRLEVAEFILKNFNNHIKIIIVFHLIIDVQILVVGRIF